MIPTPDQAMLKTRACGFLARLNSIRDEGGGALPVEELFQLTGVTPGKGWQRELGARGALEFCFAADGTGTFRNQGPAVRATLGPGELLVPRLIAGRVRCINGEAVFEFTPGSAPVGRAMFMELVLERIEVSDHHVAVRVPGGVFDQEYRF